MPAIATAPSSTLPKWPKKAVSVTLRIVCAALPNIIGHATDHTLLKPNSPANASTAGATIRLAPILNFFKLTLSLLVYRALPHHSIAQIYRKLLALLHYLPDIIYRDAQSLTHRLLQRIAIKTIPAGRLRINGHPHQPASTHAAKGATTRNEITVRTV